MDKRLFLIDAYALIYRSYYAFIKNPRINSKGENTSAIFGFVNTLEEVIRHEHPTHLAVAFDPHGKTFRHEAFEAYKAQREETPEVIKWSVPYIKEILTAYDIPILEVPGFEADDVIGTMSVLAEEKGFTTYMMTPDKDYGQLVTEKSLLYKPIFGSSGFEVLGPKQVCEKYGLSSTDQVVDLLSLMGDASDNIPGCPGVGKVTAQKLLTEYGNVENLLSHSNELKGALKEKIESNKKQIEFSKFLATIRRDVPVKFDEEKLVFKEAVHPGLVPVFEKLEFRNWASKKREEIKEDIKSEPTKSSKVKKDDLQLDLFNFNDTDTEINEDRVSAEKKYENVKRSNQTTIEINHIENEKDIDALKEEIKVQGKYAIYIKTNESNHEKGEIQILVDCRVYAIPYPFNEKIKAQLKEIFENNKIVKIGHDLKKIMLQLKQYDMELKTPYSDIMVAHYLLQPELNHSIKNLAEIYLDNFESEIESLIPLNKKLEEKIKEEQLEYLYYEVELPLIEVLSDMEYTGVNIDTDELKLFSKELSDKMEIAEKEIYSIAGEQFNINSSRQVGEILFNKLQIGNEKKAKKTKVSKQFSTSEEVLQTLKDKYPIVDKILYYRGLKKLLSTYADAFPLLINKKTGKIHTSFNQTVTATGRLSSSNPNLQNIPVREEIGRTMRKTFTAGKGNLFLSADYSQIELRIMAEMSHDEHMTDSFIKNEDIHRSTASKIFKVSMDEVTDDMRRKAKTANFGIIYGISTFGLAERMKVSRTEAKELIEEYFVTYKKIKEYMDRSIMEAKEKEWVETYWHRKRYLPDINSHNAIVRGYAERNAINAPIQGTAADMIKIAMVRIYKALKNNNLKTKLIMQVHDELNFLVPENEVEAVKIIVRENMENFPQFSVPIKAEIGVGKNWLEAH